MESKLFRLSSPAKAKRYFEDKLAFTAGPAELKYAFEHGERPEVIDVRRPEDYAEGHIPGAINIPEERWQSYARKGLSKKRANVFYCYTVVCHLATRAAAYFASRGYPVIELEGGIEMWKEYGYEVERQRKAA